MIRIIANDINELFVLQDWVECGRLNATELSKIYPHDQFEVEYSIKSDRPCKILVEDRFNHIVAIKYTDNGEIITAKAFEHMPDSKIIDPDNENKESNT